jgi:hypothetical protein
METMLTKTPTTSEPIQDPRRLLMEHSTVFKGWGTSRLLPLLRWFLYEEMLRKANDLMWENRLWPGDD